MRNTSLRISNDYNTSPPPDLDEDPRLLFTLAYSELIESLASTLFPPNEIVTGCGEVLRICPGELRPDRYVHFRAAWQPSFGVLAQISLRDLSAMSQRAFAGRHFAELGAADREGFLRRMSVGLVSTWTIVRRSPYPDEDQKALFSFLYDMILAALFGEPGYGGNHQGLGWVYANFRDLSSPGDSTP
jgi:hypothetical protein